MKKQLINSMQNDLNIIQYIGESNESYYSRLIYSAICDWIRYCILDKTNENFDEIKSKQYIHIRCEEILLGLLKMFPECKNYFYNEEDTSGNKNPINILRTRMIENGELIDFFEGVSLPKGMISSISKEYSRLLGISNSNYIYTGITRIIKYCEQDSIDYECDLSTNHAEYFLLLKESLKWENYDDVSILEVINPSLKKAPSYCWSNSNFIDDNEVYLSRIKVSDYMYDYFWLKKEENRFYISKINEHYQCFKEYRRFILWQRNQKDNAIHVEYKLLNNCVKVKMYAAIPYSEQKVMNTYGWPVNSIQNNMEYIVAKEIWSDIKDILNQLYFELLEVK